MGPPGLHALVQQPSLGASGFRSALCGASNPGHVIHPPLLALPFLALPFIPPARKPTTHHHGLLTLPLPIQDHALATNSTHPEWHVSQGRRDAPAGPRDRVPAGLAAPEANVPSPRSKGLWEWSSCLLSVQTLEDCRAHFRPAAEGRETGAVDEPSQTTEYHEDIEYWRQPPPGYLGTWRASHSTWGLAGVTRGEIVDAWGMD